MKNNAEVDFMKKRKIGNTAVSLLLAVCFLTACGAQTATSPAASPSESAASPKQAEDVPEITESAESGENPIGVDWSAFQSTMTPEEWDGLSLYPSADFYCRSGCDTVSEEALSCL